MAENWYFDGSAGKPAQGNSPDQTRAAMVFVPIAAPQASWQAALYEAARERALAQIERRNAPNLFAVWN